MKHYSERIPENLRRTVPLLVDGGRKLLGRSARRAGATARQVARKGRRIVGRTVRQTGLVARRNPWAGIGAALGTGLFLGALSGFLFFRER